MINFFSGNFPGSGCCFFYFYYFFFFKCMPPKYSFNNQLGKISLIQNLQILILFPIFFLKRKKDLQQNSHNIDSYDFFIVIRRIRFLKKRKKVGKATSFN